MGMICVVQHNTITCIIHTGTVWLVLPAAIALYYHLALIANSMLCAKCKLTTWTAETVQLLWFWLDQFFKVKLLSIFTKCK